MKRNLSALCVLSLALVGVVNAQAAAVPAANGAHYTHAQLKQMVRDAHTPEQYAALAGYYEMRQKDYLLKAAEAKQEWMRRSQNVMVVAAKYPRPVDSARYLCEYYTLMASEAGSYADKFARLAAPETPASPK
jgi:hypothetical protein